MPQVKSDGAQQNPTGDQAGGFLAGTREVFESVTGGIRDTQEEINEALGVGSGRVDPSSTPILRTSDLARRTFGVDKDLYNKSTPLLGFQYFVRVNYNGALKEFVEAYFKEQGGFESNNTLVKSVTMPSIGVESEIFNEYNRKRISQTKLKFDPIDMVFHDVSNGNTLKLWQMYYQYYFADGRYSTKSQAVKDAPVNPVDFEHRNYGYDIGTEDGRVNDVRYLYKSIEIFQVSAGSFNKVTLYNPRIVDFKHDTLDYSKNDLVEVSYTIDYEWAEYEFKSRNSTNTPQEISEEADIESYFANSNVFEYQSFDPAPSPNEPYPDGLLGDIAEIVDTVQTGIETVEAAKGFARNIAGKVQSVSALGNQIQKEVLGVDEPPFPLPSVRGFTSRIDDIPTNYPDVRRVRKGG